MTAKTKAPSPPMHVGGPTALVVQVGKTELPPARILFCSEPKPPIIATLEFGSNQHRDAHRRLDHRGDRHNAKHI
jgi:hypothetical protein